MRNARARRLRARGVLLWLLVAAAVVGLCAEGYGQRKREKKQQEAQDAAQAAAPVEEGIAIPPEAGQLTADELIVQADGAFQVGDWARAAGLYAGFLRGYGSEPAVAGVLPKVRYALCVALLQMRNFQEAARRIPEALASQPPLDLQQRQELLFWNGVCQMSLGEPTEARRSFEEFVAQFPNPQVQNPFWMMRNRMARYLPEARLLVGSCLLIEEKYAEAAEYFERLRPTLSSDNRGRATVQQLYALLQAAQGDEAHLRRALEVVVEEFPNLGHNSQIAVFQTLTLQLGALFLERGQFRNAIRCLQRIWKAERILRHQEARLEALKSRREALEANPKADPYEKYLVSQMIAKVQREIENFQKQVSDGNFDSALRFRLASAYLAMERHREAALILEDMLATMAPSPVVEQASVALVQAWNAISRDEKTIAAATAFEQKFPKSASLPLVLYLRGIAEQQSQDYPAAIATFAHIQKDFPQSDFAPRAHFMVAFTYLLFEKNPEAIREFESFLSKYPQIDLNEAAHYWLGVALSLNEEYDRCREVLAQYLKKHPNGAFAGAAKFRRAYAAHSQMNFAVSIPEMRAFLEAHPGHENEPEARILLGDALLNEGRIDEGIEIYAAIPRNKTRFYEEGVFKTAKALKLLEDYDRLKTHLLRFIEENPYSSRIAEAIFQVGWADRQQGNENQARERYWKAISEFVNNPQLRGVEDMFAALQKLYSGSDNLQDYLSRLRSLRAQFPEASPADIRLRWAEALALQKSDPHSARTLLLQTARLADPQTTSPAILADLADARLSIGDDFGALQLFRELIRWNPRAPQRDRALAEIGLAQLRANQPDQALETFARFLRESPGSRHTPRVLFAKAQLEAARSQFPQAKATLESILTHEAASGQQKAEALYRIGELHMAEGKPQLAIPYFQRIYIMHGRWRDWVAKAYLRSAEAFEKLRDTEAARKTYAELAAAPELQSFDEAKLAHQRLQALGSTPTTPPAAPEPQPTPPQT